MEFLVALLWVLSIPVVIGLGIWGILLLEPFLKPDRKPRQRRYWP